MNAACSPSPFLREALALLDDRPSRRCVASFGYEDDPCGGDPDGFGLEVGDIQAYYSGLPQPLRADQAAAQALFLSPQKTPALIKAFQVAYNASPTGKTLPIATTGVMGPNTAAALGSYFPNETRGVLQGMGGPEGLVLGVTIGTGLGAGVIWWMGGRGWTFLLSPVLGGLVFAPLMYGILTLINRKLQGPSWDYYTGYVSPADANDPAARGVPGGP